MRILCFILALAAFSAAAIIDRIAVVVNSRVVKDSDIEQDIRVVDFLNAEPLGFGPEARRQAAERLIDQTIIRRETELGNYPKPSSEEIDSFLNKIKEQRNLSALTTYGITEEELRNQLQWQLTVLKFIDLRFRTGTLVTQAELDDYAAKHPGMSHDQINEVLMGERVNAAYDAWIKRARERARIDYKEPELRPGNTGTKG